jgi:hypothetical protein
MALSRRHHGGELMLAGLHNFQVRLRNHSRALQADGGHL